MKNKKGVTIVNEFQNVLNSSKRKPNKIRGDQDSKFNNYSFKKWLKDNDIEMYSPFNNGRSVVAERFIRTLNNKIYKDMTAVSKNVYFDVLDDIVNEYNNTVHEIIKMKPIDIKSDSYAEYKQESNEKDSEFKIGDHNVRISKYKNILLKNMLQIGQKKFL